VVAGAGIDGLFNMENRTPLHLAQREPVHPNDLLATVYYALGIDPDMEIRNHLTSLELVIGQAVGRALGVTCEN